MHRRSGHQPVLQSAYLVRLFSTPLHLQPPAALRHHKPQQQAERAQHCSRCKLRAPARGGHCNDHESKLANNEEDLQHNTPLPRCPAEQAVGQIKWRLLAIASEQRCVRHLSASCALPTPRACSTSIVCIQEQCAHLSQDSSHTPPGGPHHFCGQQVRTQGLSCNANACSSDNSHPVSLTERDRQPWPRPVLAPAHTAAGRQRTLRHAQVACRDWCATCTTHSVLLPQLLTCCATPAVHSSHQSPASAPATPSSLWHQCMRL